MAVNLEVGGTELNAVRTVERLNRERFAPEVVYMRDGPLRSRYEAIGVSLRPVSLRSLHHPSTIWHCIALARYLRKAGIEVLHAHDVYSNIFAIPAARIAGVTATIASRRWLYTVPRPGLTVLNRICSAGATRVLANGESVRKLLIQEERMAHRKIEVIPNFLSEASFVGLSDAEKTSVRAAIGIPAGASVVGCVANLSGVKDHATIVRAAALLKQRGSAAHFVFLGEGQCRRGLQELAAALHVEDRIHMPGQWLRPWNLHHLFDVSVLASTSEGFPNSLLEAMAVERPIVATNVGGNADAVKDGETGLLVPPSNPSKLAGAIALLLTDESLAARLGANARADAELRYAERPVISRLESLYENLCSPRSLQDPGNAGNSEPMTAPD